MAAFRTAAAVALLAALLPSCASADGPEVLAVDVYVQNAQGFMDGGHYESALAQFRRALSVDPRSTKARLGEAYALYYLGEQGAKGSEVRLQEASVAFAALDPSDYRENAWKVDLGRGMTHSLLSDRYASAAAQRERAAATGDAVAAREREHALAKMRHHARSAEAAFRAVLERSDVPAARDNLAALFFLARAEALRARAPEDYEGALALFRRYEVQVERSKALWQSLIKSEPTAAATYEARLRGAQRQEIALRDLIANIHYKRRDHEASLAELDRILALDEGRAEAWLTRAQNHEALGRPGAAADDYRRFLALTEAPPTSEVVLRAAERMRACEARAR